MTRLDPLIEQDIESGGALVVPTGPRAAAVQLAYAGSQLESGRRAWRAPDVIAYRAWLEREAYRGADAGHAVPRPLRAAEEWFLWREAAAVAARADGLDATDRLAESLHRAARLLYDWEIPATALRSSERAECRLLARALEHAEARARDLHAAGSHQLASLLQRWRPPCAVTFAGFTDRTAARAAVIRAWADSPGRGREHIGGDPDQGAPARVRVAGSRRSDDRPAERRPESARIVRAEDSSEELALAAQWCRSRLERDPSARLLVVIPDLAQRRTEAPRVFRRVLTPQAVLAAGAEDADVVAVEGGMPLIEEPLIRHAFAALGFLVRGAEAPDLSTWLRGAFWTVPAVERARLDAAIRQALDVDVTPLGLLATLRGLSGSSQGAAERLHALVEAALGALGLPGSVARPGEWARHFEQALEALGWPGARALSPREQQALGHFTEALEDLTAIGAQLGTIAREEALSTLIALADRRALALPPRDAAVTLTGALADPIIRYDGIWIAGLHADAWPPPLTFDPFIPFAAQRRAGIPAADGARTLARAREVLRRCRDATACLVASWPARGEQREYLPSPLLAELPGVDGLRSGAGRPASADSLAPAGSLARLIRASRRIELFDDAGGEPWPPRSPLPSGTRAIELQSRCPFRAYAELRLASVPLGAPRPGVGALERGRLLHRALELLWGQLGGSQGLRTEGLGGTLTRRIEACVGQAADETLPIPRDPATRAAQRRETRRAVQLLGELAELERQRPAFRVRSTELRRSIEIEDAALDVRIDRLDELDDGSCAVFDYKTGRPTSPDWLAERIAHPQLLVYSLAAGECVSALAMIQLSPRHIAYRGMADRRDRLPRIGGPPDPASWPGQMSRWREAVGRLARDFLRGAAAVDPLGDACATCHLHGFCRIADAAERSGDRIEPLLSEHDR